MNPLRGLIGLVAIVAIFLAAFYAYSNLSQRNTNTLPQTATIGDFTSSDESEGFGGKEVAISSSTTAASQPSLEGFKENELRKGLDSIKAGLELLENPFE